MTVGRINGQHVIGRNLTDPLHGSLAGKRFLILDRDSKFSAAFRNLLLDAGVEVVRLPYRSPNLNAYAERFVRSIKDGFPTISRHSGFALPIIPWSQDLA